MTEETGDKQPEIQPDVPSEPVVTRKPLTDTELTKLAVDVKSGHVFGTWDVPDGQEGLINSIFMPLALMEPAQRQNLIDQKVVHLYEYMHQAGPRSINGFPMFMSFRSLTEGEFVRLITLVKKFVEAEQIVIDRAVREFAEGDENPTPPPAEQKNDV